jgi:hypothetical protein
MAGRRSIEETNKIREANGLPLIQKKEPKSKAILPESKKARAQEVLATMLGRKGKNVVQKVLDKALNDEDEDQMACLKLVMDRILPADYLNKVKGKSNQISIQIMGVGETTIQSSEEEEVEEDLVDIEYEEVTNEEGQE